MRVVARGRPPGLGGGFWRHPPSPRKPSLGHANVRLTVHGRLLLVARVIENQRPVAHVAKEVGISRQCAHRWIARYRTRRPAGLAERSSGPLTRPTRTPAAVEEQVLRACRDLRAKPIFLAAATGLPARNVARIMARHGVAPLSTCDPVTGQVNRASRPSVAR